MAVNFNNTQIGGYFLESEIGRGGMSRIYQATRLDSPQVFAVKIVNIQTNETEMRNFEKRFFREIKALNQLTHPAILPLLDSGQGEDGTLFMVMPLVEGGTLKDFLDEHGVLTPAQAQQVVNQIGSALDYAHSEGIVHRDVKPHNIMMMGNGNLSLADFGIAAMANVEGTAANLTATGETLGTIAYMSPELISSDHVDGRADLYALGVVMYQVLVGRLPFIGENTGVLISRQLTALPVAPQLIDPSFPPSVELVLDKALAKKPDERYQTGAELAGAFDEAFAQLPPAMMDIPMIATDDTPDSIRQANVLTPPTIIQVPKEKKLNKRIRLS